MSELENAIAEISDPKVQARVRRAVSEVKNGRRYGLVFEKHFATEQVAFPGLPIRVGSAAILRTEPANGIRHFEVVRLEGDTATIVPVGGGEEREVPTSDLLAVKPFEEPIYPGLTSLGRIDRAGPDTPSHMVWNAENFHALQMLLFTHAGKIDALYLDPPYNTGAPDWKYNNKFIDDNDTWRHSKWLSMMETRLKLAGKLLKPDGVLIVTIDEHEVHRLGVLIEQIFPTSQQQMVTIVNNPKGVDQAGFSRVEEYAIYVLPSGRAVSELPIDFLRDTVLTPDSSDSPWLSLLRRGNNSRPVDRPNLCFPIAIDPDTMRVVGYGRTLKEREKQGEVAASSFGEWEPPRGETIDGNPVIWPRRSNGDLGTWGVGASTVMRLRDQGFLRVSQFHPDEERGVINRISRKGERRIKDGDLEVVDREKSGAVVLAARTAAHKKPQTVWSRKAHDAGTHGSTMLSAFLGRSRAFMFPKSLYATADSLRTVIGDRPDAVVLDFFAGSGTTLHATALLNAQDGGRRQCILVTNNELSNKEQRQLNEQGLHAGDPEFEAAGIFESVTRPRVEAAITGVRSDGKPVEGKYLSQYLENHSYADGFEENVEFFGVEFLDPDVVSLGRQYDAIAPLLWVASGSIGEWESRDGDAPWSAPKTSTYAILFEEDSFVEFADHLKDRPEVTHVWLVTNSRLSFADMRAELPQDLTVGMLYRDYLRNFEINTAEALR